MKDNIRGLHRISKVVFSMSKPDRLCLCPCARYSVLPEGDDALACRDDGTSRP